MRQRGPTGAPHFIWHTKGGLNPANPEVPQAIKVVSALLNGGGQRAWLSAQQTWLVWAAVWACAAVESKRIRMGNGINIPFDGLAYFQTQETLRAQHNQAQQTVMSQLFSKAVESVGESQDSVKQLGGIYILDSLINAYVNNVMDSEQYYQAALNILCGFVRVKSLSG